MLKNCYFEPVLFQVLSTFCVLINVINPNCTLRSLRYSTDRILCLFYNFCNLFISKSLSRSKHEEFESNSALQIRDQKKILTPHKVVIIKLHRILEED